jgi:hypothetical protein
MGVFDPEKFKVFVSITHEFDSFNQQPLIETK